MKTTASEFLAFCKANGWVPSVRNEVVTITRTFTPGNLAQFNNLDMSYWLVLSHVPQTRPGSMWGTDGGGMGAVAALRTGRFAMNVSGVSKRFLTQLAKELATSA